MASHDGTRVAWRVDGPAGTVADGRVADGHVAVVLCNGITCDDTYWRPIWPALADEAPVVRFNYRGHAYSEAPRDPDAITVHDAVADLGAVLEVANVGRAVFVGHSYGVKVAWEAWRDHREHVAGLVGVAGSVFEPIPHIGRWNVGVVAFDIVGFLMRPARIQRLWRRGLHTPTAWHVARAGGFVGPKADYDTMRDWFKQLSERDMVLMARMMRAMQEHSAADLLPDITVPAEVLMGGRDLYTPPYHGRRIAKHMPNARYEAVPGTTHVLPIEEPDVVVNAVRRVLTRATDQTTGQTRGSTT